MTWVTSRIGIDMFFFSVFCLVTYFLLGWGKEEKYIIFYGYMNIWIFVWVTECNKLLANFR